MENIIITDNEEMVTCRICGINKKRIYGAHLKNEHKITSDEYKSMFPGAPLMAKSDLKNTTINSGKHMKEEKYKTMFSEKFKGENNPNHKNKTTEEERKSRSPFSKNFSKYEEIENKEEHISNFAKEAIKDRISPNQKEYYMVKGYSEEESIKMVSERQKTFSLDKCIEKYGEEKGLDKWKERQQKWQKSLLENGNIKCGYSAISQELFSEILFNTRLKSSKLENIYFATKNKEYYISVKGSFYIYDYVDLNSKRIIEYNGDVYHANPNIYNENDYPHPFYKKNGPSAKETWDKDSDKLSVAKNKGFDVLVIWDSEYKKNKKETIKKCIEFLS